MPKTKFAIPIKAKEGTLLLYPATRKAYKKIKIEAVIKK